MKIAFIADFFSNQIVGGAENNDSVLFDYLSKIYEVQKINSKNATIESLKQYDFFIVSNFVFLSQNCKDFIETQEYIIYEHDHKYVSTRDPSVFVDFEIPSSKIVNKDFYINAKFVVVLSEICKEVIEKNLNLKNVVNIGTSLWSDQQLDILSKNINNSKQESLCVLRSNNKVKNQAKAELWCNKNNKQYSLVGSDNYEEFIKQMSSHKGLVFIPTVLETFSRLACEAKILDLDLITNKRLLGFASETSFSLRGEELLKETRKRVASALQKFNECIQAKKHKPYIAILSLWKRGQWLEEQLDCLENQSTKPEEIWLCHGINEDNKHFLSSDMMKRFNKIKVLEDGGSIFSRFEMAKEYDGYYLVIDDDMFPSREYISNCFKFLNHHDEAIICSSGRNFKTNKYFPNTMHGSVKYGDSCKVDIGTNGWFLTYDSIREMLNNHNRDIKNNGEDIAISYLNRMNRGVESYVIKQSVFANSDVHKHKRGVGEEALSNSQNHKQFYDERNKILNYYIYKSESNWFFSNLKSDIPFAFSRFNDGEMMLIMKENKTVSRGSQVHDDSLSAALLKSMSYQKENYYKGIPLPNEYPKYHNEAKKITKNHSNIVDAICLINHDWSMFVQEFIQFFKGKQITWISGEDQNLNWFKENGISIKNHYKFPNKNTWQHFEKIKNIDLSEDKYVFISLGPTGRVLVKEWFEKYQHKTIIEFGSCFDPFTRDVWHKYHNIKNNKVTFTKQNKAFTFSAPSLDDHQASYWKKNSFYEERMLNKIKSLNLKGTYLDIGANLGNHSVYFSNFTDCERVLSFEPHPEIFKFLEKNCNRNKKKEIILHNFGLGNELEENTMCEVNEKNCGSTKIEKSGNTRIIVKRLDDLNLNNISLMKIDVEGYEEKVLLGSMETIKRNNPIIFTELATKKEFQSVKKIMDELSYETDGVNYANTPTYMWKKR